MPVSALHQSLSDLATFRFTAALLRALGPAAEFSSVTLPFFVDTAAKNTVLNAGQELVRTGVPDVTVLIKKMHDLHTLMALEVAFSQRDDAVHDVNNAWMENRDTEGTVVFLMREPWLWSLQQAMIRGRGPFTEEWTQYLNGRCVFGRYNWVMPLHVSVEVYRKGKPMVKAVSGSSTPTGTLI